MSDLNAIRKVALVHAMNGYRRSRNIPGVITGWNWLVSQGKRDRMEDGWTSKMVCTFRRRWPEKLNWYSNLLRAGRSWIESRWRQDFPHPSRPALEPTQPLIQWVPGLFPRGKATGSDVDNPPPFSAEVKGRVELYFYSPSGSSWPVLGWNLPLALRFGEETKLIPATAILIPDDPVRSSVTIVTRLPWASTWKY